MNTVILQIEGLGSFLVEASDVPQLCSQHEKTGRDLYLVDGCGRTWAPMSGGEWLLWDTGTPLRLDRSPALPPPTPPAQAQERLRRQASSLYSAGCDPYNTADSIRVSRELASDFLTWLEPSQELPQLLRRQAS